MAVVIATTRDRHLQLFIVEHRADADSMTTDLTLGELAEFAAEAVANSDELKLAWWRTCSTDGSVTPDELERAG